MSHSIAMPYLVAYDIGNNKRLRNVHKHLKNIGIPMQYSLFYCRLTHQQHQQLLDQLDEMIVDSQDDIRIYPMHRSQTGYTMAETHNQMAFYLLMRLYSHFIQS